MSASTKWITGIVIIVILGLGVWYWQRTSSSSGMNMNDMNSGSEHASSTSNPLPTSASNTSNAAINQDAAAIDAQMQGLNGDSSNVNSSVNASGSSDPNQ